MAFGDSIGGALAGAALADAHEKARDAKRDRDRAWAERNQAQSDLAALRQRHTNLLKRFSEERSAMLTEFFAKKKLMYIYADEHGMTEQDVRDLMSKHSDGSPAYEKAAADQEALSKKERAIDAEYGIKWADD